jgi:trans-aconitate methyltransferase
MSANRQSQAFFEAQYQASGDPWKFASSDYERNRYAVTLESLSRASYRRAFEPGCSIGVLTAALAPRVAHLVACDISMTAVACAKERCQELTHVEIRQCDAAAEPPEGMFDLMIFSELGYYFSADRLRAVAQGMSGRLEPGGEFVAVHWLGHSADHVLHGDEVHEVLARALPFEWIGGSRHAGFRIDSWRRSP